MRFLCCLLGLGEMRGALLLAPLGAGDEVRETMCSVGKAGRAVIF